MELLFPDIAPPVRQLPTLPPGFRYQRDFLSADEEHALLRQLIQLELKPAAYHKYTARRKTACFGLGIRFSGPLAERGLELRRNPPAPEFLQELVDKVARWAGRARADFPHVLVTEYPPGAPIGWHRDAPPFAQIYGVSLGSDCTFCLRPMLSATAAQQAVSTDAAGAAIRLRRTDTVKLTAERRSLYVMAGPARSAWQHSIPPVKATRWSITLRTL